MMSAAIITIPVTLVLFVSSACVMDTALPILSTACH